MSVITLALSLFPLLTLITLLPQIVLTGGAQGVMATGNILCTFLAFVLSTIQVKNAEKRNALNIASLVVSLFFLLIVGGIAGLALVSTI